MSFKLEETTIAKIHTALRAGEVTCVDLVEGYLARIEACLLYTSPSPRDGLLSRMPSSA